MWPQCLKTFGDFQSSRRWPFFLHRRPMSPLESSPFEGFPTATTFSDTFVGRTHPNSSYPLTKVCFCRDSFDDDMKSDEYTQHTYTYLYSTMPFRQSIKSGHQISCADAEGTFTWRIRVMIDLLPAVFFQILGATSAFMMDEKNLERFFYKKMCWNKTEKTFCLEMTHLKTTISNYLPKQNWRINW